MRYVITVRMKSGDTEDFECDDPRVSGGYIVAAWAGRERYMCRASELVSVRPKEDP